MAGAPQEMCEADRSDGQQSVSLSGSADPPRSGGYGVIVGTGVATGIGVPDGAGHTLIRGGVLEVGPSATS